ncbi:hypothetical protein SAMN05443247_08205 [Bradyrhizobium erythrophlei]|nr:hypothetical protein SAMN05443247_08205 [Bradyrhizobium erythrophlei]
MTKLLDRVDSAATKGARKEATQSHASMLTAHGSKVSSAPTVRLKTDHGSSERPKITVRIKPAR